MFLGQIFGHDDDAHLVPEPLGKILVVSVAPLHLLADQSTQRELERSAPHVGDLHVIAAHEPAAHVGLVELLAQHRRTSRAFVGTQVLVKQA